MGRSSLEKAGRCERKKNKKRTSGKKGMYIFCISCIFCGHRAVQQVLGHSNHVVSISNLQSPPSQSHPEEPHCWSRNSASFEHLVTPPRDCQDTSPTKRKGRECGRRILSDYNDFFPLTFSLGSQLDRESW